MFDSEASTFTFDIILGSPQTKYHITYEQTQMTWSYTASTHPSHKRNRHPPNSACLLPFSQNNRNRVSIPCMPHPKYLSKYLSESLFSSLYTHRNHPSFIILRKTIIHYAIILFTHKCCNTLLDLYSIVV